MTNIKIACAALAAVAALASTGVAVAGAALDPQPVTVTYASGTSGGHAEGVPQHARNSNSRVEFMSCDVKRGIVITPEGEPAAKTSGPNQRFRCVAQPASGRMVACSTTDPEAVQLLASALASATADSRLKFFFDAAGTCTHLQVELTSKLLKAQ